MPHVDSLKKWFTGQRPRLDRVGITVEFVERGLDASRTAQVDLESAEARGRATVWDTGAAEIELQGRTGERLMFEAHPLLTGVRLAALLGDLVMRMRRAGDRFDSSIDDVLEFIVLHRLPGLSLRALTDLVDTLSWSFDPEVDVNRSVDEWLNSDDRVHVEIALGERSVFPLNTLNDMRNTFDRLCTRWPDLRARCDELIRARVAQNGENA